MGKKGQMTSEQAVTFQSFSVANAAALMDAAKVRGCTCQPYTDWFTYDRWQAQGMQVQKGEHGVPLVTYIPIKDKATGEETGKRPWHYRAFCRCQVRPIGEAPAAEPAPIPALEMVGG